MAEREVDRLAHDFANVLTRIRGFAELARRRIGPDHDAFADLAQVLAATEEAIALTEQLRGAGDATG